ncbi:hypothetical protein [Streptomyces chiangmaiensis]|uniref:Holin n=1 Tax=Streptomyces chiangmaiensis TaxID=766497 RepID=A0ABU7FFU8_9ACTN|nr:hypothetical protein [Streptomyces chiangmaiensis]MED7822974.1 hypothetical protein [Streptomyces chiangmaiensis]
MYDATRRALRTALQTLVAIIPLLAEDPSLSDVPALAGVVAAATVLSRLMAVPAVERLLPHWLRKEGGP